MITIWIPDTRSRSVGAFVGVVRGDIQLFVRMSLGGQRGDIGLGSALESRWAIPSPRWRYVSDRRRRRAHFAAMMTQIANTHTFARRVRITHRHVHPIYRCAMCERAMTEDPDTSFTYCVYVCVCVGDGALVRSALMGHRAQHFILC